MSESERERAIEAAMVEIADFLPDYPDGGRVLRACAERVVAAVLAVVSSGEVTSE